MRGKTRSVCRTKVYISKKEVKGPRSTEVSQLTLSESKRKEGEGPEFLGSENGERLDVTMSTPAWLDLRQKRGRKQLKPRPGLRAKYDGTETLSHTYLMSSLVLPFHQLSLPSVNHVFQLFKSFLEAISPIT